MGPGMELNRPALTTLVSVFALAASACAVGTGDGLTENEMQNDLLSAGQLHGSDLPAKTLALTFDDGPAGRTREPTATL